MTPRRCPITGIPLRETQYVSSAAAQQLRADLSGLDNLLADLNDALGKRVNFGARGAQVPPALRAPINIALLGPINTITETLQTWAGELAKYAGQAQPYQVPRAVWWYRALVGVEGWEQAPACIQELSKAISWAVRLVDRPPDRTYAGPCPACGQDVTAPPHSATAQCVCGQTIDVAQAQEQMRADLEEMLLPKLWAHAAAEYIVGRKIPDKTLDTWDRRGQLLTLPAGGGRAPGWRVADIVRLASMPPEAKGKRGRKKQPAR